MLVWDEGVLDILVKARAAGDVPTDSAYKVSVYTGHANPASIRILEELGADSLNPVGDLSRPMLGAIREAVTIPLDIWAITFDSFGGMNRLWEAGEIAAYFGDQAILIFLAKESAAPAKLKLSDQQFTFEPYGLALARGDADFRLLVDRTLAHTYRSGRIDTLFKGAFGENANPTPALRALYLINGLVE